MKAAWPAFQDALSTYVQAVQPALCELFQQLDPALDPQVAILALPLALQDEVILLPSKRSLYATEWKQNDFEIGRAHV